MEYTYIDGDNIGLKIETSFLENNELALIAINGNVKESINQITTLLRDLRQQIIFSGADGIICKGMHLDISEVLDYIRLNNKEMTFSIGTGNSLKDSYIALRYAKSLSKNIAIKYSNGEFEIIDGKKTTKK